MSIELQEILDRVERLSEDERCELLSVLVQKDPASHRAKVLEVYGKYAHSLSSSEEFLRQKRDEISIEDRRTAS